jgi:hypothetical protein
MSKTSRGHGGASVLDVLGKEIIPFSIQWRWWRFFPSLLSEEQRRRLILLPDFDMLGVLFQGFQNWRYKRY